MHAVFVDLLGQDPQKHGGQDEEDLSSSEVDHLLTARCQDLYLCCDFPHMSVHQLYHFRQRHAPEIIVIYLLQIHEVGYPVVVQVFKHEREHAFLIVAVTESAQLFLDAVVVGHAAGCQKHEHGAAILGAIDLESDLVRIFESDGGLAVLSR